MLDVIEAWHTAVNAGDAPAAGALCTDDVQVGGPRGAGRGRGLLVGWVGHAAVRLQPLRWFCGDDGAGVEQDARWVLRHTDLDGALAAAGLTTKDEVTARR